MTMTMEQRLLAARRSVRLATRQAHSALISSGETIVGPLSLSAGDREDRDDDDPAVVAEDDDAADDGALRAGMDLGLSLFGTSQSYRDQVEEEFDERLRRVEGELDEIRSGLAGLIGKEEGGGGAATTTTMAMASDDDDDDDAYSDYGDATTETSAGGDGDEASAEELQRRVAFLQECVRARRILDDVDALSSTTDFAAAGCGVDSPRNVDAASSLYSPSSICSPSEFMRFTFDSVGAGAGGGGGGADADGSSPLVRASRMVRRAEEILDGVTDGLNQRHGGVAGGAGIHDDGGVGRMQWEMLDELRNQTRRRKMELRHRASSLADGCVAFEEGSLLVRGVGSGGGTGAALDPGESPISASTPANAAPPSPLSDAYQVLQKFADENFPAFGETLDGAAKRLSRRLLDAIRPCLEELESAKDEHRTAKRDGSRAVGYYKFAQETLGGGARSSSWGDHKYDPAAGVRGPAERLGWTLLRTTFGEGGGGGDEGSPAPRVATRADLDGKALSSSSLPSGDVAAFLSSLNFLSNVLSFVHERVLLRRADLAAMLGRHLFGTYPLPSEATSIDSGSAVLGGGSVLVGAAAQGIEEGESMPLMTALVGFMRRSCMPAAGGAGGDEVEWGALREMEACLIREVGEFEEKMAGMGLMNSSAEAGDDRGGSSDVASSPTGLSVLLNEEPDGLVDSPIHPNKTALSVLTALDTTFPPAPAARRTNADRAATRVLSPLSHLARALRQAHVEDRRSRVLERGRSILLNTDYHDTVRAGTRVPDDDRPLADAGGDASSPLASLDADRTSELFAFHECSVSTTARRMLDLCRGTLDDAVAASAPSLSSSSSEEDRLDSLPPMLYRASRELLDLFRAVVPTLHASEVGSIPRTAAVLHNDCVYLAHEALLLGAEYKNKFRSADPNAENSLEGQGNKTKLLGEVCSFVDMVPPFRDLATKSMGSMIELQKGQLYELVSPRLANFQQALASNESVSEWDDAETALRAALYHLRHLSQAWTPVLSRHVYQMSMGNLVDLVLTLFLDPVWKARDITEASSRFVHALFLDMARGCAELFLVGGDATDERRRETPSAEDAMQRRFRAARRYASLFEKSRTVGRFMTMRLGEIQRGLEEGVFRSVTARELSHLISAAFDESQQRTALLNALASK